MLVVTENFIWRATIKRPHGVDAAKNIVYLPGQRAPTLIANFLNNHYWIIST